MQKCLVLLMIFAVIGCAVPSYAGFDSMILYDNFNKNKGAINALKWVGIEYESDTNHRVIRESARQIEGQQLHLGITTKATCTDCGNTGTLYGQNRLKVRTSATAATAKALKATMTANKVTLLGGSANTSPAIVEARFLGFFFNDGTSSGSSDSTGDVHAYVCLRKASDSAIPENKVQIQGYVWRCKDSGCTSAEAVAGSPVSLGTLPIGQPVTLYVEWDQTNHKFIFQKIKGQKLKATEEISYNGILTDTASPVNASNYRLDVKGIVPIDSTAATVLGTIPTAAIDVSFDDVYYSN